MKSKFTQIGFVLSAAGSAIGLGNVWKFPYMTGENGGGAFVLIYLITIFFVGITLFIAEVVLGRLSRTDPVGTFETLATKHGKKWKYAGFAIIGSMLIASFYMVIIGWILKYMYEMFVNLPSTIEASSAIFGGFVTADFNMQFILFNLVFFIVFFIVSKGIKGGIEKANLILMPLLILILGFMLFYSFSMDGFGKSFEFLFYPDFSKVTGKTIITAVGQAFFTLSLGVGTIMTYGASLSDDTNIVKSSFQVAFLDTFIALMAGLIIFTLIFQYNAEPAQGSGLVFISLPTLFYQLGSFGNIIGMLFFVALAFAGITSAISMIEPSVFFMIKRFKFSRVKALFAVGAPVYIFGTMSLMTNIDNLKRFVTYFGIGFFDILDKLTTLWMMPISGVCVAVFTGYFVKKELVYNLLSKHMSDTLFNIWYFAIRYVAPISVIIILINGIIGS
ncbi:sodium-dependent transporter, SNF family [Campylobacter blaseri]|uniref:Transporter n=1 Tax=Campylobacter blaseri TaxID=2042961 RepID=A0A2P8R0I7_9BACT|nr:sodium-dependent transporter [Campylobacter blaseri]PSM52013.1 sodium-dependent transporter [Campylobacter blaseri]PSM53798.1 sodium-dependent transporter [Campylobacter blaseri]QKF85650.1 sodium-dependent transporter, SNF family [Campylobacter blaseri]